MRSFRQFASSSLSALLATACVLATACGSAEDGSPPHAAPLAESAPAPTPPASAAQPTPGEPVSPAPAAQPAPSAWDGSAGELLCAEGVPPQWELVLLDVATGGRRVLGAAGSELAGACAGCWSPDGSHLAVRVPRDGQWRLATLAADGSELRWHVPEWSVGSVAWWPDGGSLLVDEEHDGPAIWRVPLDGAAPVRLATGHSPLLSPDGLWLLATRTGDRLDIDVLHLPSGSLAPLTAAPLFSGNAFTRAGDHLYIGRKHPSGVWQIIGTQWPAPQRWKRETDGTFDLLPTPSPDGRTLAFVRREGAAAEAGAAGEEAARDELWARDVGAGTERRWPLDGARAAGESTLHELAWSPDGTRLALVVGGGELTAPRRLLLLDVQSGAATLLRDAGEGQLAWPAWRPRPDSPAAPPAR